MINFMYVKKLKFLVPLSIFVMETCGSPSKGYHGFVYKRKSAVKPQSHIHDFGPGRATIHTGLSNRDASA